MKTAHKLFYTLFFGFVITFVSCNKEEVLPANELDNFKLAKSMHANNHTIDFYTSHGKFLTGYNEIYFQIKNADGSLINNATADWKTVMHMTSMSHSGPYSTISKKEKAEFTYTGFVIFQMAGNEMEHWEMTLNYNVNGTAFTATSQIDVQAAPKRVVQSFKGSDDKSYVLALVEPKSPKVAVNNIKAMLYTKENMMSFIPVENYTVKIDPRMPGMGNHSSPNNVDLTHAGNGVYSGKLSLTMTGYWMINLQLLDAQHNVLKGEAVSDSVENSSIFFEIEF